MLSVMPRAPSQAGQGLRGIDSEAAPDRSKGAVKAQAVAANRNDAAMEPIVGRSRLEPRLTAAAGQVHHAIQDV